VWGGGGCEPVVYPPEFLEKEIKIERKNEKYRILPPTIQIILKSYSSVLDILDRSIK
jgi:hypothetical protein